VLPFLAEAELIGEPGEEFSYSNLSAAAAGYLAVLAVNPESSDLYADYADLLAERVLHPIGMNTAVVRASETEANPDYGRSCVLDENGHPQPADPEDWDDDPLAPAGSLKASAREMALFISTQLQQGVAPNGSRVVSAANLTETWRPHLESYGMGWETSHPQGVTLISHEGAFDNYLSVIGLLPEYNLGFVILANSEEAADEFIEEAPAFLVELVADQQ
jgi:CubicO group peptidase (beta-lactamase class C family)